MSGYSHILVAANLAADHERILPRAAAIARAFGSKVTLLHVVDLMESGGEVPTPAADVMTEPGSALPKSATGLSANEDLVFRRLERGAYTFLEGLAQGLGLPGVETEVIESSSTWRAIVEVAIEKGADLIVVGSHPREGLNWIFGSTTDRVVRRALCDVLAVHD
ncbi:MAG: universal stress protein [Burkholderiales bacterium]